MTSGTANHQGGGAEPLGKEQSTPLQGINLLGVIAKVGKTKPGKRIIGGDKPLPRIKENPGRKKVSQPSVENECERMVKSGPNSRGGRGQTTGTEEIPIKSVGLLWTRMRGSEGAG